MHERYGWVGTKQVAKILGVSQKRVGDYLRAGRVHGAYKVHSKMWLIPLFAGAPIIKRCSKGPKPKWSVPRRPPLQKIHVNQEFLRYNTNHPEKAVPIFAIEGYEGKVYAEGVIFNGMSQLVHNPHRHLGCGAYAWEETKEPVSLVGSTASFHEIRAIIDAQNALEELENPSPKNRKRKSQANGFGTPAKPPSTGSNHLRSKTPQPVSAIA